MKSRLLLAQLLCAEKPTEERIKCAGSDGNSEGVVNKSEEKILTDVAHRRAT